MKKIERRMTPSSNVKLITRAEGGGKSIAGMAAAFYDGTPATEYELWNFSNERAVERILPGAFDLALSRPDDVRGLFNHDANHVLGRTTSGTMTLTKDAKGLQYAITPADTGIGRDVVQHLTRKDVTGSSFAFIIDEERWTETKTADDQWFVLREIINVTLYDVGPVTFPAYESSTSGMRADGDVAEAMRSLDEFRAGAGNTRRVTPAPRTSAPSSPTRPPSEHLIPGRTQAERQRFIDNAEWAERMRQRGEQMQLEQAGRRAAAGW